MVDHDRFSTGASVLDLHSKDQSHHPPSLPNAVIWPVTRSEVSEVVKYANMKGIAVVGWGSGSSLDGNPIPVRGGIVLDFSQMNRILDIREQDFQADLEPGVIYQDLNHNLRHKGLFFPPDPGARATIGGMIANNASGTRTVRYGATKDHILRLTVVLANGEILELGTRATKTSSGYDLVHLIVGSEGTLGIVVETTVRLVGLPEALSIGIASFPTVESAGRVVFEIMRGGLDPAALELLSPECVELINKERDLGFPVSPTLFIEFHGPSKAHLAEVMGMAEALCCEEGADEFRTGLETDEREKLWKARHELGEMIVRNHPERDHMGIDVAVPVTAYPEMIALAKDEVGKAGIPGYIFSHAGDGNFHLVMMAKKGDRRETAVFEKINNRIVSKAIGLGGTATGEHGVGLGKRQFMVHEHGLSLEWMRKIKGLFDPKGILNPEKVFPI
jgi:D-lactate dehydrogenase (cytochrome)